MSHPSYQSPVKASTLGDTNTSPKGRFFLNKTYMNNMNAQSTKSKKPADVSIQLPDVEGARKDMSTFTKLPAVTDLINIRATHLDPEVNKAMVDLTKYAQNLEHIIRSKDKEIERLEYINKYLTLTQQSREHLLTQTLEENRRLKEMSYRADKRTPEKKVQIKKVSSPGSQLTNSGSKKLLSQQSNIKHTASYPDNLLNIASPNASEVKSPLLGKNKQNNSRPRDDRKSQSVLQMNEEEVNVLYSENESFAFLEDLLRNEDNFIHQVAEFQQDKLIKFYESIQTLREDHSTLRDMIFKLRRIIKATITMTTSLVLDEAIERIIDETCECLDCDRASTFIYDSTREELWSKKAKGSDESIRVPVNKGIVGHVFTKGEALNIHNAYTDERFNKQVDLKTGYKTTTMLTVPVKDDNGSVIGVVQAVNKKGMGSIFTKDDEALLTILSNIAGVVLRNSMTYNQQLSFHNVLRSALKSGVYLNSLHDLIQLLPSAEKKLKSLMGIERAQIVLRHPYKNELFSVQSDGTVQSYPLNCGIIGKVVVTGEYENITNGYGHPLFNGLVDIETSMPLLCVPMNHPSTDKVIGAIEVINTKGIQGLSALQRANVDALDKETLEFFSKQLAQAVLNCFEWDKINSKTSPGRPALFQEGDTDNPEPFEKRNSQTKYTIRQVPPEQNT